MTAPAKAVAAWPAGNELERTWYSGWISGWVTNGRGRTTRSLMPNVAASAANTTSAVRAATPAVGRRRRQRQ